MMRALLDSLAIVKFERMAPSKLERPMKLLYLLGFKLDTAPVFAMASKIFEE